VIEEVPVQVDVVLVHAPQPGEAPGIHRVYQHERHVFGKPPRDAFAEQEALDARAAEALDSVRARGDEEQAARVRRPEARGV
jgi:hypothetical protein